MPTKSRTLRAVALTLALTVPSSGCVGLVRGYSVLGAPITQSERDERSSIVRYSWRYVPDPPREYWNPGVLLLNVGASLVLDVAVVGLLIIWFNLCRGDDDDEDLERALDAQAERVKRGEYSWPQQDPR